MYISYLDNREIINSYTRGNITLENLGKSLRIKFKRYEKCLEVECESNYHANIKFAECKSELYAYGYTTLKYQETSDYMLRYNLFDNFIEIDKAQEHCFYGSCFIKLANFNFTRLEDSLTMYELLEKYMD